MLYNDISLSEPHKSTVHEAARGVISHQSSPSFHVIGGLFAYNGYPNRSVATYISKQLQRFSLFSDGSEREVPIS